MTPPPEQPESSDFIENPLRVRCIEVVELVTHYLDGALDVDDKQSVEAHLAGCEHCTIFVSQIRLTVKLSAAAGQNEPVKLPANFAALSGLVARRAGQQ